MLHLWLPHLQRYTGSCRLGETTDCCYSLFCVSFPNLVDTWAESVCIHQLILKPHSKSACI